MSAKKINEANKRQDTMGWKSRFKQWSAGEKRGREGRRSKAGGGGEGLEIGES